MKFHKSKLLALAFSLVVLSANSVFALPTQQLEITYFTNSQYTTEAGHEVRPSCSGRSSPLQGRRTRFAVRVAEKCNGGGSIKQIACFLDGHLTSCPANICESHLVNCH